MKIRCRNCGTEFDSKFCPECGASRESATQIDEISINNYICKDKHRSNEIILNIIRWIVIVFLVIVLIGMILNLEILSSIAILIGIFVISPLNRIIPYKKNPRFVYGIVTFSMFVLAFVFYHPIDSTEIKEKTILEKSDSENNTVIDKRTQKRITKIEKYIENGKYEKAYQMLNELVVDEHEKARLYALYYTSTSDYYMAEKILYEYCIKFKPLSDVEEDSLYFKLMDLYDKVPDKQEELDLFKHSVYISKVGYEKGHDWKNAECTTKKKCKICGEETGEPLGHNWIDATCIEAKKCSRCGEKEGVPLGHDVEKWKITKKPICSEEGAEIGICMRCGEEVEQKVAKIEHKAGKWEITRETTSASIPGEKSLLCKVCGEVMETEKYTISKEEELKIYRKSFESVSYEELSRYPDSYKGKKIKVTVKIVDEMEEGIILYTPYKAKMGGKDIAINDGRDVKEPKLLKGDTVTVYGLGDGTETVKTKRPGILWDKTIDSTEIPMVKMLYCEF
ncbi:hypothetical protein [Butyrivibrio sp. INlla21]|uniref:hypothetical protein n=1 Tax=Butyrivibrio sp. INlla21 TaxID=1520811 RepID=UPI0008DF01E0|nr:hypothetical protein [Butyrivibrio sp. INlla21]SFU71404.1 hypothetical protein SAMN02910342_01489 [Butyrivibrio sp. INlla21]